MFGKFPERPRNDFFCGPPFQRLHITIGVYINDLRAYMTIYCHSHMYCTYESFEEKTPYVPKMSTPHLHSLKKVPSFSHFLTYGKGIKHWRSSRTSKLCNDRTKVAVESLRNVPYVKPFLTVLFFDTCVYEQHPAAHPFVSYDTMNVVLLPDTTRRDAPAFAKYKCSPRIATGITRSADRMAHSSRVSLAG